MVSDEVSYFEISRGDGIEYYGGRDNDSESF
jgi:hypothetical protein